MGTVLVTGTSSFLGYHVAKQLNEAGIRPRVLELPGSNLDPLDRLDVERCRGSLDDPAATRAACSGVDTLLHLAYKVSVGGGRELLDEMERVNVEGTKRLLQDARANGVRRAVVTGSALAIGVNRRPVPLDESASWSEHAFELSYGNVRRRAEHAALAEATPAFAVVSVCPSFTFGPDDPVGAPANKLIEALLSRKLRFTLPIGIGCLDVRDFARGVLLAAERGRSGERYLLSGENVTATQLLEQASAIGGIRAPTFVPPTALLHILVGALGLFYKVRRKSPPVTREVLQVIGRYAWYDSTKAREELGWTPRPLRETLADTIAWIRDPDAGAHAPPVRSQGAATP